MKTKAYHFILLLITFISLHVAARTDREYFMNLQNTKTIFVGTTDTDQSEELWGKITDNIAVSNLVNIISESVPHPDSWYPLTYETVLFFCDAKNEPIVALTCLNLLDEDSSQGIVRQFSLFKASISNDVFIIGQRITTTPWLIRDMFGAKPVKLLLRKPSTRANEKLMSNEIVKVIALEGAERKRFLMDESNAPDNSEASNLKGRVLEGTGPALEGSQGSGTALSLEFKDDAPPVDSEHPTPKP